ncbi:MAG: hypothetical protein BWY95_00974 [Bacteroidetes bacterium ADurb.BinA104]|nr:MAG: hypothetical protein BWY95_00974 [Bacteroidetes bacterium ADurb.BinA104]
MFSYPVNSGASLSVYLLTAPAQSLKSMSPISPARALYQYAILGLNPICTLLVDSCQSLTCVHPSNPAPAPTFALYVAYSTWYLGPVPYHSTFILSLLSLTAAMFCGFIDFVRHAYTLLHSVSIPSALRARALNVYVVFAINPMMSFSPNDHVIAVPHVCAELLLTIPYSPNNASI